MSETAIEIRPNSRPQEEFLASTEYEVMYGGSAGGGKSYALVLDPLRYIDIPKFTGIIFRRTYPELEGSIIPLTQELYPHFGAVFNVQSKTWRFPTPGVQIRLGFMQYVEDWRDYQGHNYTYHGYDELTNFEEDQYVGLQPWNRTRCSVKPYRRSSANPGGVGHQWVKERFVKVCPPQKLGEMVWSTEAQMYWQPMASGSTYTWTEPKTQKTLTRKFIPARVFDNVDNLRLNPDYLVQLLSMPLERRRALLEGDWDVFEGQFYDELRQDIHYVPPVNPHFGCSILGAIDYGDKCAVEIAFMDYEGNIVFFAESYTEGIAPQERANRLADLLLERRLFKINLLYDTDMEINLKNYTGNDLIPINLFRDILTQRMGDNAPNLMLVSKHATHQYGYRIGCNEAIRAALHWKMSADGSKRLGPKMFITHSNPMLWKSISSLAYDTKSPGGMDFIQGPTIFDHPFDASKYVVMGLWQPAQRTPIETWMERFAKQANVGSQSYWMPGMG